MLRDAAASARLFETSGVLLADGLPAARGRAQIAAVCTRLWRDGQSYVADAGRVVTARDVALVLGKDAVHVLRRGRDGSWRSVITVLARATGPPSPGAGP